MKSSKKTLARIMAFCLTLVMALSLATMGAFAAPITSSTQTGSITVQGTEKDANETVNLYKIIDVNMDGTAAQPKDPVYIWNSSVAQWVKVNHSTYIGDNNAVTKAFADAAASDLSAFYTAMANAIKDGTITPISAAATGTLDGTTYSHTFAKLAMGQYLVIADDDGSYTHSPATATLYPRWDDTQWVLDDATAVLKGDNGTIEKGASDIDVSIGDTVTYTVKASIPTYPSNATAKQFKVGDTMGTGLTWGKTVTVFWSADGTDFTGKTVEKANYTLATDDIKGATFEVRFNYDALKEAYPTAKYVHVQYTATINEKAFTKDSLGNTAYLGVNTNPYDDSTYDTTKVEEHVYTYGITVTKVDGENPLPGAQFRLYSDVACENEIKFQGSEGVYTKAKEQTGDGVDLVTDSTGKIQLKGLATGTYYLKETKAPGGYQLPANPVTTVVLTDATGTTPPDKADGTLDNGTTTVTGTMVVGESTAINTNVVSFQVKNEKTGFTLPTTGGMGTVIFTAGGLALMACGGVLILMTMKKRKGED